MNVRVMVVLGTFLLALVAGCSDKTEQGGGQDSKQALEQSVKPNLDLEKTKAFFSMVSAKTLGKTYGKVELQGGILVHPGDTPTRVVFSLKDIEPTVTLAAFIATLPADALASNNTGTVGFELILDGKSLGRKPVDRFTNIVEKITIGNAKTLTVIVDNGNGEPWADWLILGLQ